MKYLIIGTGGIGNSVGGFLASKENDVAFIARGKTYEALKKNGLKIKSGIKGELYISNINVFSSDEYSDKADVIFVCVKDYSLDSVIPVIKKASHEKSIIIPLLNGYSISEKISNKLDIKYIIDGCIYISAFIESPGSIVQLGTLFTIVFGTRKEMYLDPDILNNIKNTLTDCGITAVLSDKIETEIFKKFSFVSTCAACGAYYDIPVGPMQKVGKYRATFLKLCQEIKEIGNKLGLEFDFDLLEINLKILDSMMSDISSSMQKDIKAGNKTEMDSLIFNVIRLAENLGVEVPVYREIADKLASVYILEKEKLNEL